MKLFSALLLLSAGSLLALESPRAKPSYQTEPVVKSTPAIQVEKTDPRPFKNNPEAGGLSISRGEQILGPYTAVTITFPEDVVTADKIDAEDVESPIAIWPELDTDFLWTTQTEGYFVANGPFIPGQTYRFRLREGLKDLSGHPLPVDDWGFEMQTAPLKVVDEGYGERDDLNALPQVPLTFNYAIDLVTAANGIWFQDRVTRKKYPVEILLNRASGEMGSPTEEIVAKTPPPTDVSFFRVRPATPLPVDRQFDLVVDGVRDAFGGQTLQYPQVFALGVTRPLRVDYVLAANYPLEKPRVEVKFRQSLSDDPLPPDALKIIPTVPNLKVVQDGGYLIAEGDFDITRRYEVTIGASVRGAGGYGLAKAETWGATFRPKTGTVIFPSRQIRERSALGLSFAFYQVNTSALTWTLTSIPREKLAEVLKREHEFDDFQTDDEGNPIWTKEGLLKRVSSEPLALGTPPVASGSFPADTTGAEILREISWQPEQPATLEGPMLLEIVGKNSEGKVIGNRAVIYFGEAAVTRKVTPETTIVRAAGLTDGQPLAGATITVLDDKLTEIAKATCDAQGMAQWPGTAIAGATYFLVEAEGISTLQPVDLADQFSSGYLSSRPPPALRAFTFTDRNLYRPGQSIQFKGFVRQEQDERLVMSAAKTVTWSLERQYGGSEVIASGEAKLDANGSWNAQWTPPEDSGLGDFCVKVQVAGQPAGNPANFQIEEFRNPAFSVICEEETATEPATARISVTSQYFHGAPNVASKVRWTATWVGDFSDGYYSSFDGDEMTRVDVYSEGVANRSYMEEANGEAVLDAQGRVILTCPQPFKDPGNRAHSWVAWKVDIVGPDGQTITGGTAFSVPMAPVLLGVKREDEPAEGKVEFVWDAKEMAGRSKPASVAASLFLVETKSVKEKLAPNVYRYRNFDQYSLVEKREHVKDEKLSFTPAKPGRYVLVLTPPAASGAFPVSEDAYLSGDEESEVPVTSETTATVFSVKNSREGQAWKVGETAVFNVLAPSGGVAWVTVETNKILDTFTVPLPGNTSRIEIPVKPEYEPNAFVTVYLLKPGEKTSLAGEMFGSAALNVVAPNRRLDLQVATDRLIYQPREKVSGTVTVTAAGQPVANADLAIYAVDDAILELGRWQLPEMIASFFPGRSWAVLTYSALKAYIDKVEPGWLTMKGFTVGDGGAEEYANTTFVRKEFKPIILWQPNVRTDSKGVARFTCEAPDNLTRFRVVAVGQTKESQFGAGDNTFEVTRDLIVEPALPRFLREGDEVELRAVVRQKAGDSEKVLVKCSVGGELELLEPGQQEVTAEKNAPVVVRFKARAKATGMSQAKFEVATGKLADAAQIDLPIAPPTLLRKESVGGRVGNNVFAVREVAPGQWEKGKGTFTFAVSSTPYLSKLMGLPYLLEYPHGCFEQKSSRLLGYTYLANLLEYLPDAGARKKNYEKVIAETLREFSTSLLPDGRLPYWPGGTTPDNYVTIQAAWCAGEAEAAGYEIPENLASDLYTTLEKMALNKGGFEPSPTLRAFAFFVLATYEELPEEVKAAAEELYLQRDHLTAEGKAMLAIALHLLEAAPEKQEQLVNELPPTVATAEFNPQTFSSPTRTEALCLLARYLIGPEEQDAALREKLDRLLDQAAGLSTQENLWLLVAFEATLGEEEAPRINVAGLRPKPAEVSGNTTAVKWAPQDLGQIPVFEPRGLPLPKILGSFVLSAEYRTDERDTPLVTEGFRVERVVRNLTDAKRDGSPAAPFKIGDQLLISYRFSNEKNQNYVALEDQLPAGIEVVNPNLAMFGEHYQVPDAANTAALSHSEMRDKQTNLYFDSLSAGGHSYSVLARATAAGTFIWPATQISPMYDSRFYGRSPSSTCTVSAE